MEVVFLLLLFFGFSVLQGAARKKRTGRPRLPGGEAESPPMAGDLLAELRKAMEQLKEGPVQPKRLPVPAPGAEAAGPPTAEAPRGRFVFERPERPVVDLDDEAQLAVTRRLKWAADRAGALTEADHRAFDARIRKRPPPKTSAADPEARMREFFVWQEILGKPVALRDPDRQDAGRG
jgi:hypothetical protein